jgi:hypothetical protein
MEILFGIIGLILGSFITYLIIKPKLEATEELDI